MLGVELSEVVQKYVEVARGEFQVKHACRGNQSEAPRETRSGLFVICQGTIRGDGVLTTETKEFKVL